jgi:hypothetical protein
VDVDVKKRGSASTVSLGKEGACSVGINIAPISINGWDGKEPEPEI